MKPLISLLFITLAASFCSTTIASETTTNKAPTARSSNALEQRFSAQHQKLIPVVAVADMFYACNKATNSDGEPHQLDDLVNVMDKATLANKLMGCLKDNNLQSDVALNYGLLGCFHSQMKDLAKAEYDKKMAHVQELLKSLPREDRQKTFTKCVTKQAIHFLK